MRVALVTCERFQTLTADDQLLADALVRRTADVRAAVWNDSCENWRSFDLTVVRSTWDYIHDPQAFQRWIDEASAQTRLFNAPVLLHWNLHKRYLLELERAGIAIVPTTLIRQGADPGFEGVVRNIGADEFVLKPAISASAHHTYVFGSGHRDRSQAPAILGALTREGDVLAQPFLREVYGPGERSLIFIAGAFSHAVRRPPLSAGAAGGESRETGITPSQAELAIARSALATLPAEPLYARVDLLPLSGGGVALTELELIEPALYFSHYPQSAEALADAILQRVFT